MSSAENGNQSMKISVMAANSHQWRIMCGIWLIAWRSMAVA